MSLLIMPVDDLISKNKVYTNFRDKNQKKKKERKGKKKAFFKKKFTLSTSFKITALNPLFEEILVTAISRRTDREMF